MNQPVEAFVEAPINSEENKKDSTCINCTITFSSLLYILVSIFFLLHLMSAEEAMEGKCTEKLDWNMTNFCQNVLTWQFSAIIGLLFPGVFTLFFGCSMLLIQHKTDSEMKSMVEKLWISYIFVTALGKMIITCILWHSQILATKIAYGFTVASTIFFYTMGVELFAVIILLVLLIWKMCCVDLC